MGTLGRWGAGVDAGVLGLGDAEAPGALGAGGLHVNAAGPK